MIPGVTPIDSYAVSLLPAAYDLSDPDTLQSLLRDPFGPRIYLLEASPYDPVGAALVNVRAASQDYQTAPSDSLVSKLFPGRLITPYNFQASVFSGGRLATRSIPAFGDNRIANPDGQLDAWASYSWAYRDLVIKVGQPGYTYSQYGVVNTITVEDLTWKWNEIAIHLRDYQFKLAKPIQSNLYRGTNGCLLGNGTTTLGSGSLTCPAGSMTMETWVRPTTSTTATEVFAGWRSGTAAGNRLFQFAGGTANTPRFQVRNDAGTAFVAQPTLSIAAGQEFHIAGVLDISAGNIRCVIDGVTVATTAVTGTFNTVLSTFYVMQTDAGTALFPGTMDELRIWSSALSDATIAANKGSEILATTSGLVALYRFNETSGTTAFDSTSGAHNLTITAPTWVGSLEGDSSLAGKCKPLAYGQVRQVEPVCVDSFNLIYQWHDGSVQGPSALSDGAVALTGDGDVSDLRTTTVTSGHYKTDNARGLLRLGATPAGKLTLDGQGDNSGGYVSTAADLVRRIVTRKGGITDPDGLDVATLTAANTANSAVHNYATRLDAINIEAVIDELAASVGAFWTYSRAGLFRFVILPTPGTPVATLGDADVVQDAMERVIIPPPAKRVRLGYKRYWATQTPGEMGTGVAASVQADLGQDYRYVTAENGTVATAYLNAEQDELVSLMDTAADAQAEANRRVTLTGVRRQLIHVPLVAGLFVYNMGDTIAFDSSITRYGLAGWKGVVVGIVEDAGDGSGPGSIELDLWG